MPKKKKRKRLKKDKASEKSEFVNKNKKDINEIIKDANHVPGMICFIRHAEMIYDPSQIMIETKYDPPLTDFGK